MSRIRPSRPSRSIKSDNVKNGTITGDDIGTYPCDGNTQFVEMKDDDILGGCPFGDPDNLPNCDEVPVGSMCEADGRCPNVGDVNNRGSFEIYTRESW